MMRDLLVCSCLLVVCLLSVQSAPSKLAEKAKLERTLVNFIRSLKTPAEKRVQTIKREECKDEWPEEACFSPDYDVCQNSLPKKYCKKTCNQCTQTAKKALLQQREDGAVKREKTQQKRQDLGQEEDCEIIGEDYIPGYGTSLSVSGPCTVTRDVCGCEPEPENCECYIPADIPAESILAGELLEPCTIEASHVEDDMEYYAVTGLCPVTRPFCGCEAEEWEKTCGCEIHVAKGLLKRLFYGACPILNC